MIITDNKGIEVMSEAELEAELKKCEIGPVKVAGYAAMITLLISLWGIGTFMFMKGIRSMVLEYYGVNHSALIERLEK